MLTKRSDCLHCEDDTLQTDHPDMLGLGRYSSAIQICLTVLCERRVGICPVTRRKPWFVPYAIADLLDVEVVQCHDAYVMGVLATMCNKECSDTC